MEPADLLRLRQIWLTSLSPDGQHVAIIAGRDPSIRSPYMPHGTRSEFSLQCDVWVAPIAGGPAINVTQGDRNAGTSWLLQWSPKGTRLAALTTQGSTDRVRVLIWTVGARQGVVLPEEPVYTETRARRSGNGETGPVAWLNEDELLFVAVDPGHDATTMQLAPDAWRRSLAGAEVTSSVLETGLARSHSEKHWSKLKKLHVPTGTTITLATVPPEYQRQTSLGLEVSPTGRHVAVVGDIGPNAIPPEVAMSADNERRKRIGIVTVEGRGSEAVIDWVPGVAGPRDVTVRWSPDGSRLCVFGKVLPDAFAANDPATPATALFVIGPDRRVAPVPLNGRRASAAEWADAGRLLVLARGESKGDSRDAASRQDWWLVRVDGSGMENLTHSMESTPASVVRLADGRYAGLARGALVTISPNGVQTLTGADIKPRSIAWPRTGGTAVSNSLFVQAEGDERWFRADVDGGQIRTRAFARPGPETRFAGYHRSPEGAAVAVFTGATNTGSFLWAVPDDGPAKPIFTTNEFLAEIESGERRLIEYRNSDGELLKGALLLPPGYKEGTKIPMMVWVYGGTRVTSTSVLQGKSSTAIFNDELLAARGIAVLQPSVPMSPNGSAVAEPMSEIAKSVLPAVDRVIEMGIADPQRIGVGGNSYGGYATYALLTQTSRFRAAIAADGDSNLFTSYTALSGADQYLDSAAEAREGIWWAEASQGRMGATPWRDPLRYMRNSPFFALDRINTPLLILHCDLDYVPIAHAEQMFVGLDRLGKTARFVRYFGEKHGTYSPANLQDLWRQIYRWLDEFLLPVETPKSAATFK
jgi:dipeptidyl aminopeptidase/acylaminoacyl peptidase